MCAYVLATSFLLNLSLPHHLPSARILTRRHVRHGKARLRRGGKGGRHQPPRRRRRPYGNNAGAVGRDIGCWVGGRPMRWARGLRRRGGLSGQAGWQRRRNRGK